MAWTKALPQEKLPEGSREVVTIEERAILFIHHAGKIYAVENACPHMRLSLKGGKIDGTTITCPWHHSAFDLESGDVKVWSVWPPAVGPLLGAITRKKALSIFPSKVEAGYIWVDLEPRDG